MPGKHLHERSPRRTQRHRVGGWVGVLGSRSSTIVVVGRSKIGIVLGSCCRWSLVVNDRRMGIILGGR